MLSKNTNRRKLRAPWSRRAFDIKCLPTKSRGRQSLNSVLPKLTRHQVQFLKTTYKIKSNLESNFLNLICNQILAEQCSGSELFLLEYTLQPQTSQEPGRLQSQSRCQRHPSAVARSWLWEQGTYPRDTRLRGAMLCYQRQEHLWPPKAQPGQRTT